MLVVLGCKNENAPVDQKIEELAKAKTIDPKELSLPDACSMITDVKIKEIFNLKEVTININTASNPENQGSKSCFFKWDDLDTPNAGILIQLQTNPIYGEYNEYISQFVKSKLTDGETMLGDDKPMIYKKFEAGTLEGAYSFQQAKFYWNIGNNYLVMLAMNISTLSEDKMLKAAEKIAIQINSNFVDNL